MEEAVNENTKDSEEEILQDDEGASEIEANEVSEVEENHNAGAGNEIASLKQEIKALQDKYLRSLAEMENVKKRHMKEKADLNRYQGERILLDLLDIVDTFELSQQYSESEFSQYKAGVDLIYKKFQEFLSKWEVRGQSAVGEPFDPNRHNAISQVPDESKPSGTVVGELKKAYFYKDRLIRHGEVVVTSGKE